MSTYLGALPENATTRQIGEKIFATPCFNAVATALGLDKEAFLALVPADAIDKSLDEGDRKLLASLLYVAFLAVLATTSIPEAKRTRLLKEMYTKIESSPDTALGAVEEVGKQFTPDEQAAIKATGKVLEAECKRPAGSAASSEYKAIVASVEAEGPLGPWYKKPVNIALIAGGVLAVVAIGVVVHKRRGA